MTFFSQGFHNLEHYRQTHRQRDRCNSRVVL